MSDALQDSAPSSRPWLGPLMVLAGGVCIGFAPIGLRWGLDALGPISIAFWRYAFSIPVLLALVIVAERRLPAAPNRILVLAAACFSFDIALWHVGLSLTTVANATFIVNLGNVGAGLTAWLFLRQRPGAAWAIAAPVALAGAAALSFGGGTESLADWRGDLLALGAAVLVSGYIVASSVARRTIGALDAIFWLTVFEALITAPLVVFAGESFLPAAPQGFLSPLFLALVAQVAGQGFIVFGLGRTAPALAGVLVLVQPVVAALVSWRLFGESMTGLQAGGAALILVGVFLAQRRRRVKNPSQSTAISEGAMEA